MFGFIKRCFFTGLTLLSTVNLLSAALLNAIPLSCISMNNQEYKVRPQTVNLNGDEPVLFPFSIKTSKCSGSWNNINNHMQNCVFLMLLKIWMLKYLKESFILIFLHFVLIGLEWDSITLFTKMNFFFFKKSNFNTICTRYIYGLLLLTWTYFNDVNGDRNILINSQLKRILFMNSDKTKWNKT